MRYAIEYTSERAGASEMRIGQFIEAMRYADHLASYGWVRDPSVVDLNTGRVIYLGKQRRSE